MAPSHDPSSRPTAISDGKMRSRLTSHLEGALDTDRPVEKNYHIRSALQRLLVDDAESD